MAWSDAGFPGTPFLPGFDGNVTRLFQKTLAVTSVLGKNAGPITRKITGSPGWMRRVRGRRPRAGAPPRSRTRPGGFRIDVVGLREDGRIDLGECRWSPVGSWSGLVQELGRPIAAYPKAENRTVRGGLFTRQRSRAQGGLVETARAEKSGAPLALWGGRTGWTLGGGWGRWFHGSKVGRFPVQGSSLRRMARGS
jgi:hypothetical protein